MRADALGPSGTFFVADGAAPRALRQDIAWRRTGRSSLRSACYVPCLEDPKEMGAALLDRLNSERDHIVSMWIDAAFEPYSDRTQKAFRGISDPFSNPLGDAYSTELGAIFDVLVDDRPLDEIQPNLDRITQITCIQKLMPSEALSFVFRLKGIVRSMLPGKPQPAELATVQHVESRIDQLVMLAFDGYVGHHKRIAEIRIRETKRKVSTMFRMNQIAWDEPEPGSQEGRSG